MLLPESGRFEVGLNYWASHAATGMWSDWSEEAVRRDFEVCRDYGLLTLRVFPRWDEFQPIRALRKAGTTGGRFSEVRLGEEALPETAPGKYGLSEIMLQRFETLCDLAEACGIKLIVPLLTGHMTARLYVPEALIGLDLYRNPLALKYEVLFIRGFVERLKHHPAIAAWESGNETNWLGEIPENDETFWVWSHLIHGAIRQADPSRPVIGVDCRPGITRCSIASQVETADYLTVHPYAMWFPEVIREELNHPRAVLHAPLDNKMVSDLAGIPCFIEETGTWRPAIGSPETLAGSLRLILWNAWREDARALLWWCAFDQTGFPFAPYDWAWPGCEHGVFTAEREAYPVAKVLRDFARMVKELPFALPLRKPHAVCILDSRPTGYGAGILARQSGLDLEFQWANQSLRQAETYLLPSCSGRGGLTNRMWEALKARVRDDGATLYLSLDGCYLDHLSEVCGMEVLSRRQTEDEAVCRFADFELRFPRKFRYRMRALGAKVLGSEPDGNPCCFEHRYGKGRVITFTQPLEQALLGVTDGFERGAWRFYRMLFGPERRFTPESESVLASEHPLEDGRVAMLLTNCSDEPFRQEFGLVVEGQYTDAADAGVEGGVLTLPPDTGLLLLIKK